MFSVSFSFARQGVSKVPRNEPNGILYEWQSLNATFTCFRLCTGTGAFSSHLLLLLLLLLLLFYRSVLLILWTEHRELLSFQPGSHSSGLMHRQADAFDLLHIPVASLSSPLHWKHTLLSRMKGVECNGVSVPTATSSTASHTLDTQEVTG